jgi:hypothetical protein
MQCLFYIKGLIFGTNLNIIVKFNLITHLKFIELIIIDLKLSTEMIIHIRNFFSKNYIFNESPCCLQKDLQIFDEKIIN